MIFNKHFGGLRKYKQLIYIVNDNVYVLHVTPLIIIYHNEENLCGYI